MIEIHTFQYTPLQFCKKIFFIVWKRINVLRFLLLFFYGFVCAHCHIEWCNPKKPNILTKAASTEKVLAWGKSAQPGNVFIHYGKPTVQERSVRVFKLVPEDLDGKNCFIQCVRILTSLWGSRLLFQPNKI